MERQTAIVQELPHSLHHQFDIHRFLRRETGGRLLNRNDQRMILTTEDFVVGFQQALEEEVGDAAAEIMYRCGFEWGKADINGFEKRFRTEFGKSPDEMIGGFVMEMWWWPLQAAGWGSWEYDLSHQSDGLIFVDLYESAIAKSVGNIGKVACHYYAGMFAAVFSHLVKRDLSGIEIQCYSMGEDFCKFLIGASKRIQATQFWVREGATANEIISRL